MSSLLKSYLVEIIRVVGTITSAVEFIVYLIIGVIGVISPNIGVAGVTGFIAIGFTCDLLLLLSMYLICPELNSPPALRCSLISNLVYSIGSSSYKVLKRASSIIMFLCFLTYIL